MTYVYVTWFGVIVWFLKIGGVLLTTTYGVVYREGMTTGNCTYEYLTTGHRVTVEYPGEPMHHHDFRTLADARRFAAGYEGRDCEARVRPITEPYTTCHDCGAHFHGLPYGAHACNR